MMKTLQLTSRSKGDNTKMKQNEKFILVSTRSKLSIEYLLEITTFSLISRYPIPLQGFKLFYNSNNKLYYLYILPAFQYLFKTLFFNLYYNNHR